MESWKSCWVARHSDPHGDHGYTQRRIVIVERGEFGHRSADNTSVSV
jgi:hypothetical protein